MRRFPWVVLLLPAVAFAQLEAKFSLPQQKYMAGEPVFLIYSVRNTSSETLTIYQAEPNSFCSGYRVTVDRTDANVTAPCSWGYAGSCLSSSVQLKPGETRSERFLVNYDHDMKSPGRYRVEASHRLAFSAAASWTYSSFTTGPAIETSAAFEVEIVEGDDARLRAVLQPYFADLSSNDFQRSAAARRVVEKLSTAAVEDLALTLSHAPRPEGLAIPALKAANTPATRKRLAEIAESQNDSYPAALAALADTGDRSYWPLAQTLASDAKPGQLWTYLDAAARLGGEKAVPWLFGKLSSPDAKVRQAVMQALAKTGSRNAVGPIIDMLGDPNTDVQVTAQSALLMLTHHAFNGSQIVPEDSATARVAWVRWWTQHRDSTHIYSPNEPYCGNAESLN